MRYDIWTMEHTMDWAGVDTAACFDGLICEQMHSCTLHFAANKTNNSSLLLLLGLVSK